VSIPKVTIALTADQVADIVLAAAGSGHGAPAPLLDWLDPTTLASSTLIDDPTLCRSLIVGLAMLLSFPATGETRGTKEITEALGLRTSTGHRYMRTLLRIGLLAQDPSTRQYRRVGR
jgi:hypothetical protein